MVYFLSLGSNLGEREQTLRQAMQLIEQQIGPILRCSSFYYSEPWGFESEHTFCNLCCAVETTQNPEDILLTTQAIERALGRKEKSTAATQHSPAPHYTDRTIDIDLIRAFDANGQEIFMNTPFLVLPHPLWQQREFVKVPLAEIMKI